MRRIPTAATLAAAIAFTTGCATTAPPISDSVAEYYKTHSTLQATTKGSRPVVAFIGDSYAAGAGLQDQSKRWTTLFAQSMVWQEANLARGGTGYLKTSGKQGCGLDVCPNYDQMISAVKAAVPDVVVVSGGRNDAGLPGPEVDAAIAAFFNDLKTALPKTRLVTVSPVWDSRQVPAQLGDIAAAAKAGTESAGGVYLNIGEPLFGHPELVGPDNVHPLESGHAAIFEALKIQAAGLPAL